MLGSVDRLSNNNTIIGSTLFERNSTYLSALLADL